MVTVVKLKNFSICTTCNTWWKLRKLSIRQYLMETNQSAQCLIFCCSFLCHNMRDGDNKYSKDERPIDYGKLIILKPKHWLLLLTGGNVCRKAFSKKPWYLEEPGVFSGRSLCTRSLASLSGLANSAWKCRWIQFEFQTLLGSPRFARFYIDPTWRTRPL